MKPPMPVLWAYGASGVGKTTATWRLFERLTAAGIPLGYLDIDQVGMCYPGEGQAATSADPDRYRLKTANLERLLPHFRTAGAHGVIVPGVVDAIDGVQTDLLPSAELTLVHLTAQPDRLVERLRRRDRITDDAAEAMTHAQSLINSGLPGTKINTSDLHPETVADQIVAAAPGWPRSPGSSTRDGSSLPRTTPAGEILILTGRRAVGTSLVGWLTYSLHRKQGRHMAYVDLEQLGFLRAGAADTRDSRQRLQINNLVELWEAYAERGAERLVVAGRVHDATMINDLRTALPAASITVARLTADPATLQHRIQRRSQGIGSLPGVAGDDLLGLSVDGVRSLSQKESEHQRAADRADLGDLRVETTDRDPEEIAAQLLREVD